MFLVVAVMTAPFVAFGQDSSTGLPGETAPRDVMQAAASSTEAQIVPSNNAASVPRATGTTSPIQTTTVSPRPASSSPTAAPVITSLTTTSATFTPLPEAPLPEDTEHVVLWIVLAVLAMLPFGYLAAKALKSRDKTVQNETENKDDCSRCLDIRRILEKKWRELTDLRGRIEGKLQGMIRDEIREAAKGTVAEDPLALAEKAEKEYGMLKKLFKECMIEFEKKALNGVIVEESLLEKSMLEHVHIAQTCRIAEWTMHDVLIEEKAIPKLQRNLRDGPWYMHFWRKGKDHVQVVFKDRIFDIKISDTSTWKEMIAHGGTIGIPEDQLNF